MTVFVVTSGSYDDYRIRAVFSSRQLAQAYINQAELDALTALHPGASVTDFSGASKCSPDEPVCGIEEYLMDSAEPVKYAHITTADRYPGHILPADFPKEFIGPVEGFKR